MAIRIVETSDKALGHHGADLFSWEIDDRYQQPSNQISDGIVSGDLGAGFQDADLWTKIDMENVGWFPRLGKLFSRDNPADAEFDLQEIIELNQVTLHPEQQNRSTD